MGAQAAEAGRPLRIAFIGARGVGTAYSGIETYYEEVGARLVARGHQVFAYCRRHAMPPGRDLHGITPVFQPCIRSKHGETFSHTLFSTGHALFRPYDIVQFHALGPSLFSGVPRLRGVRTVASIRGLDWQREKWGRFAREFLQFCERQSYRLPTATSVVSRTLQRHYRDAYGVDVTCIPNGVTIEPVPPPQEIQRLGLAGRDYFLFMGRLSPEKGCDVLLEAFRSVGGRAKLVMAGGTSYTDTFLEQLKRSAPPGVIFPGVVGGRLKEELYGHALAFVLPSSIEGLSVALLEAMAHGACPITSDIPENLELVEGVGWTAPPGDARALAALLKRALDSPDEAAEHGRRARARVESDYTWDEVTRKTEAFYYDVLRSDDR